MTQTITDPSDEQAREAIKAIRKWQRNNEAIPDYDVIETLTGELEARVQRREIDGMTLYAHDTGDGWALGVRSCAGELVGYLEWPKSWPNTMTADDLREKGFVVE